MSDMHPPKLAALRALSAGRLTAAGEARLARHLAQCETCRTAHRGQHAFFVLRADLQTLTPEVDFARVALRLREQTRKTRRRRQALGAVTAVAAAAAIYLISLARPHAPPPHRSMPSDGATTAAVRATELPAPALLAGITALRGNVMRAGEGGPPRALTLDDVVREGDVLTCEGGCEAHVHIAPGTGFVLAEHSRVRVAQLREGQTLLELQAGVVTSRVRSLASHEHFDVRARDHVVAVRGTHFEVSVRDQTLGVRVSEGHVLILDRAGQTVSDLRAPSTFVLGGHAVPQAALELRAPRELPPIDALASLRLEPLPVPKWARSSALEQIVVDGTAFEPVGELAIRVPAGNVTLRVTLADLRSRTLQLSVPPQGLRLESATLHKLLNAERDARTGALDGAQIMAVVRRGLPALERCYERALKQRPDIVGKLMLRITLDGRGRVLHAEARAGAAELPGELLGCLRASTKRWVFPAPGGKGMTFDAPIRLARR